DDFSVAAEGAIPEYEWINLEGVTANPYTLEDLEANTEYEAQVASVKGEEVSEWTKSTNFMTGESGVEGIKADAKADNVWYNLLGVRLNGKPSQAGIYINNGKKIFIK
ncbi:MAG: fibronectin type III domain-containing protein, partial [Muribaculaceae bacterium]|nr:fibronectin type III domain-containing protein [Muribaculaceae bacterium]